MEYEVNGSIPFLDVVVSRKSDGSFSRGVFFCKKMKTEEYIHVQSHHYPSQKLGVHADSHH